jgi:hypothetical protein
MSSYLNVMYNLINKKEHLLKIITDIALKIIIIWKWGRGGLCIISLYIKKCIVRIFMKNRDCNIAISFNRPYISLGREVSTIVSLQCVGFLGTH